jgi:N-acetyl-gamma-glutamyl-phosphate reductase
MCTDPDTVIIDASTAHRVADGWAYGFPELNAEQKAKVASSKRIANPGCYPTGMIALTRPLVDAGFLPSGTGLVVHAVSGYSGGGKQLMAIHQAGEAEPWGAYGESRHRRVKSSSSQIIVPIPTVSYPKKNENRSTRTGAGD